MRFTKKTMNNVFNNVFLKFGEVYEMQADKMYYSTRYLIFNSITKQVVGAGYTLEDTFLSLMSYLSYYHDKNYYDNERFYQFAIHNNLI